MRSARRQTMNGRSEREAIQPLDYEIAELTAEEEDARRQACFGATLVAVLVVICLALWWVKP
jgi:hypothetical protein